MIPDDTDVLITHRPPFGILDLRFGKGEPAGCELLLKRVQEIEPRVHLFGHIHGSYGKVQIGRTLFVNACLAMRSTIRLTRSTYQPEVVSVA